MERKKIGTETNIIRDAIPSSDNNGTETNITREMLYRVFHK